MKAQNISSSDTVTSDTPTSGISNTLIPTIPISDANPNTPPSNTESWWPKILNPFSYLSSSSDLSSSRQELVGSDERVNYWFNIKEKRTQFHQFCQNGELASLKILISQIENDKVRNHSPVSLILGQQDINGYTALHLACKYGHIGIIKLLLKHMNVEDIQAKTTDKDGYDALHFACLYTNDPDVIELLFARESGSFYTEIKESDKKIFTTATNGKNLLHCAAAGGNEKMVEYLLTHMSFKQSISLTKSVLPLHSHLNLNHKLIGTADIKPNSVNKSGFSALHLAASKGHLKIVKLLLDHFNTYVGTGDIVFDIPDDFIVIDSQDVPKTHSTGSQKSAYIELKTEDDNGNNALHLATIGGFVDIIEYFLSCDPDLGLIKNNHGNTPLHLVSNRMCTLKLLEVEYHSPLSSKNQCGNTFLHEAALNGRLEVVKVLVESMKDFTFLTLLCYEPNTKGQTPLHLSASDSITRLLLDNLEKQYEIISCLNIINSSKTDSSVSDSPAKRKTLTTEKEHKKFVYDCLDKEGNTVLHYASHGGLNDTVKLILTRDKKTANIINKKGHAPIHLAKNDSIGLSLLKHTSNDIILAKVPFPKLLESKKYSSESTKITFNSDTTYYSKPKPYDKTTLLHIMIQRNQHKVVKELLSRNINGIIDKLDDNGNTSFHSVPSEEMGNLLLPYLKEEHLRAVNKGGQTILHTAVQKNICTKTELTADYFFVEGIIERRPELLSMQDKKGAFPIDLANTPEMARTLVRYCDEELLKKIIWTHKGDWNHGIGLIVTELLPGFLKYVLNGYHAENQKDKTGSSDFSLKVSDEDSLDSISDEGQESTRDSKNLADFPNNTGISGLFAHIEKELAKTGEVIAHLGQIKRLKSRNDEFVIIEGQQLDNNTDYDKILLKHANLSYVLGKTEQALYSYDKLFSQAPKYIAETLNWLSNDELFTQLLLSTMKEFKYGPWNNGQVPGEISDNLLYKFTMEGKQHIVIMLFEAKISTDYFHQVLKSAIEEKETHILNSLLKSLASSEGVNELWQLPSMFLCKAIETEDHDIVDIFLKYMTNEVAISVNENFKFLYHAQSEEMIYKLVRKYPDLADDSKIYENLYNSDHCIPLIANYNRTDLKDPVILCRKGYVLDLLGKKQHAMECFSKAREIFSNYQKNPQNPLKYSNEIIQELIKAQINNETTIVKVLELSDLGNEFEGFLEIDSPYSQAIAIKLPCGSWVNIFMKPGEVPTLVCTGTKKYPELNKIISFISKAFFESGSGINFINLDQTEQDGLHTSVVENLARMANYKGGFTKKQINEILTQASVDEISNKHLLMLEHENFYSDVKLNKLLTILLLEAHIAPTIDFNDHLKLEAAFANALESNRTAVIPLHPSEKQWSSLIIKRNDDGKLLVSYSNVSGNPLALENKAEFIISYILQKSHEAIFVDSQRQIESNDNGARTIENIVAVVTGQTLEFDRKLAEDKHLQLLRENKIPVPNIDENDMQHENASIQPNCFPVIKNYDDCFTKGRAAYEAGEIKLSSNYYTKALKICDLQSPDIEIEGAKYRWLADKAYGTIFTTLCRMVESSKNSNDGKFSVVALKSQTSHAALLLGYKQDAIQMIHFDSEGILLSLKKNLVSIIGELISDIKLSIIDIASKVKDTTLECFEGALTQLQQFNSDLFTRDNLLKNITESGHLQMNAAGEGLELSDHQD